MSKVEKTVERSIYGQDYNYYFALTNSLYCTVGEAKMRLSANYFFGNQNMVDAQASAQLQRGTGLMRQKLASAMGWKWDRLAHKIGLPEIDGFSHLFCSLL